GAPLGAALVGAVRGRIRECGNGTPILIPGANGVQKNGTTPRPPCARGQSSIAGRATGIGSAPGRAGAPRCGAVAARVRRRASRGRVRPENVVRTWSVRVRTPEPR